MKRNKFNLYENKILLSILIKYLFFHSAIRQNMLISHTQEELFKYSHIKSYSFSTDSRKYFNRISRKEPSNGFFTVSMDRVVSITTVLHSRFYA